MTFSRRRSDGSRRLYINQNYSEDPNEKWSLQWGHSTWCGHDYETPPVANFRTKREALAKKQEMESS